MTDDTKRTGNGPERLSLELEMALPDTPLRKTEGSGLERLSLEPETAKPEVSLQKKADAGSDKLAIEPEKKVEPKPVKKKKSTTRKVLGFLFLCFFSLGILGAVALGVVIYWVSLDLPPYTRIADYRLPVVTTVYARDKSVIGYLFEEKRYIISLAEMPEHLRKAFIAAEDASFYEHMGIDPLAIARAFWINTTSGRTRSGASTITQQIVKRLLLTSQKSYGRKLREALLAIQLERHLSKEEILSIYLNEIYLGNTAYGVEAAARMYFGKRAGELTLGESAVLATLPQAPSTNNPVNNPIATKTRQKYVLGQMLRHGWINQEQHDEAYTQPLIYKSEPDPSWKFGAWYLEEVRRELLAMFSEENVRDKGIKIEMYGKDAVYLAGLHVYTAMEPVHQLAAETALRQSLVDTAKRQGWRGPLETVAKADVEAFLKKNKFNPVDLENAGWAKALVTRVTARGATVRLGEYIGTIGIETMTWARIPDASVAPEEARVDNATKVLKVGDVVWVSAVGATGTANPLGAPLRTGKNAAPEYKAANVVADKPIALCLEQLPDAQGALISMETQTGDVVALVGGYQHSSGNQYNRATQARRQPGSSFKPIVYSAALDNGFTAASVLMDTPVMLMANAGKAWKPSNYDNTFRGPLLLRTALALSRNVCTVQVAQKMGMAAVVQRAAAMGIEGKIPQELAVSLGAYVVTPMMMAKAYSAFADGGKRTTPRLIIAVKDTWGQDLVVNQPEKIQAISAQNAFIMADLLKGVVNAGTATRAKVLNRPVAGKTGTTNDERDAWFIGFTPELVTSVYTGYDQVRSLGKFESGSRTTIPPFINYFRKIEHLYPPNDFTEPEGIVFATVDSTNGKLAGPATVTAFTLPFIPGTEPKERTGYQSVGESGESLLRQF